MNLKNTKIAKICHGFRCVAFWSVILCAVPVIFPQAVWAGDWPTYKHDNYRSATTSEQLDLPLEEDWIYSTARSPRPAWPDTPALQNFWGGSYGHRSRVNVDRAPHTAIVGDKLYFGSSNSDQVVCLDSRNGLEKWKFFTGGPVRYAPTIYNGNVYVGSDDGYVYCLDSNNGSKQWNVKATTNDELMFANGRMVSTSPVRTSVLVENGVAYWGAGMFNGNQTGLDWHLCAYSAGTGAEVWNNPPSKRMLGYLLSLNGNLYVPAGKSGPIRYRQSDGGGAAAVGVAGCFALIIPASDFANGPAYSSSGSYINDPGAAIANVYGNCLIVSSGYSYYCTDTNLVKINRSTGASQWNVSSPYRYALILAGDTIYAGGDDEVAAFSTANGQNLWTRPVDGRALGLAVAQGRLYVNTDRGTIHAFGNLDSPQAFNRADFNQNGQVDLPDLMMIVLSWLDCTNPNDDVNCDPVTP
jgi:outer membrane protein assembly factor BamB